MATRIRLAIGRLCRGLVPALFAGLVAGPVLAVEAQEAGARSPAVQSLEELQVLDEVWVHGKQLSQRIEMAEDNFFAMYNKLNGNPQFDIRCGHMSLSRGSMIMTRACVPDFIAQEVVYYFPSRTVTQDCYTGYTPIASNYPCQARGYERPPLAAVAQHSRQAYADNVMQVIHSDEQLRDMARELAILYGELELAQQRYVELKSESAPVVRRVLRPRGF